jgi:hypothetical protein
VGSPKEDDCGDAEEEEEEEEEEGLLVTVFR